VWLEHERIGEIRSNTVGKRVDIWGEFDLRGYPHSGRLYEWDLGGGGVLRLCCYKAQSKLVDRPCNDLQ